MSLLFAETVVRRKCAKLDERAKYYELLGDANKALGDVEGATRAFRMATWHYQMASAINAAYENALLDKRNQDALYDLMRLLKKKKVA